jgi:hypothetical protein
MGSDHVTLLQHTERSALVIKGQSIDMFLLRDKLQVYFTDQNVSLV